MILSKKTIILQVFETVADRRRMLSKVTPSGKRSKVKRSKKYQVDEGNKRFSMWGCAAFFGECKWGKKESRSFNTFDLEASDQLVISRQFESKDLGNKYVHRKREVYDLCK